MEKRIRLCLDRYLKKNDISRYALAKATGIGYPTIDRYYKNQVLRYDNDVLSRIVTALDCKIEDIIEITDEK
ncbi:MAG: helix-turn-helix transcriptional regulator [Oscillospiraceae bacterium]|nr:helix-turn-helix transcriptional regulator [Oscillospiraceae bacterium]